MPGFLGRDLSKCREFAAKWYGDNLPNQIVKVMIKLLTHSLSYTECFIAGLKDHLGNRILGFNGC